MRESDESLLELDPVIRDRDEEVRLRVRVDDRLEGDLRLAHLQRRPVLHAVLAGDREEVADDGDRWVEIRGTSRRGRLGRRGRHFRSGRRRSLRGGRRRSLRSGSRRRGSWSRGRRGLLREDRRGRRKTETNEEEKFSGTAHENLLERLRASRRRRARGARDALGGGGRGAAVAREYGENADCEKALRNRPDGAGLGSDDVAWSRGEQERPVGAAREAVVTRRRIHGGGRAANGERLIARGRRRLGMESEGRQSGETRGDEHHDANALEAADFHHRHTSILASNGGR